MDISKIIVFAQKNYQKGFLQQSAEACKQILAKDSHNVDALNLLGVIYYEINDYDTALQYILTALSFDKSEFNLYQNLRNLQKTEGIHDAAIAAYKKVLQLNPTCAKTYYCIGNIMKERNQFDEAIDYYSKALKLNGDMKDAYNNLGAILYKRGKTNEALKQFQKYIYLSSKLLRIFINKKKDSVIFINLKCAYTTFKHYVSQNRVDRWRGKKWDQFYTLALVRCPYKRIESFYKDKIIQQVTSQHILPGHLDYLSYFFPKKRIIMKDVSFEEFVYAIERGYMDEHLIPQHENIPGNVDKVVHLEKKEEHQIIMQRFNIEFEKTHSTKDINLELVWTDKMKEIIQKYYHKDFHLFGYEM